MKNSEKYLRSILRRLNEVAIAFLLGVAWVPSHHKALHQNMMAVCMGTLPKVILETMGNATKVSH